MRAFSNRGFASNCKFVFLLVVWEPGIIRVMEGSKQQPDIGGKSQPIPLGGRLVMVRCPGFRCLAYRDKDGKWRDVAHDEERPEILEILWEF
jgi:hypothetical protein